MRTSATKPEEKRLDCSVQRGVDHTKIRINPAAETRNRVQFVRRMPKQRQKSDRRLDQGAKQLLHTREGILLGECRFKSLRLHFAGRLKIFGRDVVIPSAAMVPVVSAGEMIAIGTF
jgi:hypothetical protein